MAPRDALASLPTQRWRGGSASGEAAARSLPEEAAVAFVVDGRAHAVMMATPADLEDFALGFCLAEGIVSEPAQIRAIEVVARGDDGIELQIVRARREIAVLAAPAQRLTGPTGCGLCGVSSLDQALRPLPAPRRSSLRMSAGGIAEAMRALAASQTWNRRAHALHAAAFWQPTTGLVALREDVGRHCALDKLAGALARRGIDGGAGAVLLTSRVSIELVQKTARLGAVLMIAVSAPTALAVRSAEAAGITLVAVARGCDFEVFTHPERITADAGSRCAQPRDAHGTAALRGGASHAATMASATPT